MLWIAQCVECKQPFTTPRLGTRICSDTCKRTRNSKAASKAIMRRYYSDPEFRDKMIADSNARRADKLGLGNKHITIGYLLERASWICGICNTPITTRNDASLDHIIPLSRGGEHTLANTQPAHRHCNYSKGNKLQHEMVF